VQPFDERGFDLVRCCLSLQDRSFRLLAANRRFVESFGAFEGRHCYEVYKRRSEPCDPCPVARTFRDGDRRVGFIFAVILSFLSVYTITERSILQHSEDLWFLFMLFYLLTFAVGAAIVVGLGADLLTGITASIACLGNIGPGFGAIGPMASFADLHPVSKIVLTLEMWIGRLEVLTVLVLFRFEAWRTSRWAAS